MQDYKDSLDANSYITTIANAPWLYAKVSYNGIFTNAQGLALKRSVAKPLRMADSKTAYVGRGPRKKRVGASRQRFASYDKSRGEKRTMLLILNSF